LGKGEIKQLKLKTIHHRRRKKIEKREEESAQIQHEARKIVKTERMDKLKFSAKTPKAKKRKK
jgi:hypothetical protein